MEEAFEEDEESLMLVFYISDILSVVLELISVVAILLPSGIMAVYARPLLVLVKGDLCPR